MTDAAFWDRIAPKYALSPVRDEAAYAKTVERTASHLRPGDRVLEIGAGTGTTGTKLAGGVSEYLVTDISSGMIEVAKGRVAEAGIAGLRAEVAPAESAGAGAAPWDAILAFNLLHLVRDLDGLLASVRGRMAPGGRFVSKTAVLAGKWYLRPVIGAMQLVGKAPYLAWLSERDVRAAIENAGFRIVETGEFPKGAFFVVAEAV